MTPNGDRAATARWRRVGAAAGIVAALAIVADLITLASSPSLNGSAAEIAGYVTRNSGMTLVMSYVGAVTSLLLVPFIASLRMFVPDDRADGEWQWTITVTCGAVAVSALLVGSGLRAAAADLATRGGADAAVAALFGAAKVTLTFALLPIAVIVLSNAQTLALSSSRVRWLVRFGREIAVISLLSTLSIFFRDNDVLGPGEPVVAAAAFLLTLWLIATSVTMLQSGAGAASPSRPG